MKIFRIFIVFAILGLVALPSFTQAATTAAAKPKTAVKTDSKQIMIIQTLPIFVKVFGNNPTNAEKAWWRKRISCGEIKSLTQLTNSMQFHKSKKARKGSDYICGIKPVAASSSSTSVIKKALEGVSDHPQGDTVRIGIYNTDGKTIAVTANGPFWVYEGNEKKAHVGKEDIVNVSWSSGAYHVRGAAKFDAKEKIRMVPDKSSIIMELPNYKDLSKTYAGKNYNRFRGVIEVRKCDNCKELWAINELRTELYLRGLAETSGKGPEEYLKTLGIAARTYVLFHKIVTGGRSEHKGWDITNTADDQLYRGYEYELIAPELARVFAKVSGVVATDSQADNLVSTVYFSDSDGRTRTAKEVWGTARFPYLQKSVKDPHHVSKTCLGHCVGMSAQGAYGFAAKDGWNFEKILTYFYSGIKLVKAY